MVKRKKKKKKGCVCEREKSEPKGIINDVNEEKLKNQKHKTERTHKRGPFSKSEILVV